MSNRREVLLVLLCHFNYCKYTTIEKQKDTSVSLLCKLGTSGIYASLLANSGMQEAISHNSMGNILQASRFALLFWA